MAPPGPSEATCIEAYEKRRDGMSYREIAAAMAGPPHRCGGHTTARRWVALGHALVTRDEDGRLDPMLKRRARREMAIDALDSIRVEMAADVEGGNLPRDAYYRLRIEAIRLAVQIGGWRAAPEPARVKVSGAGTKKPATPRDLFESLAAIPQSELDALIDDMLPSERTDR